MLKLLVFILILLFIWSPLIMEVLIPKRCKFKEIVKYSIEDDNFIIDYMQENAFKRIVIGELIRFYGKDKDEHRDFIYLGEL